MERKYFYPGAAMLAAAIMFAGCNESQGEATSDIHSSAEKVTYQAELTSINSEVSEKKAKGIAKFIIYDDTMHVSIKMVDTPPNMMHWQHFHGFEDGSPATCASMEQDVNNDGIIDVVETETVSGTTMVPFNKIPVEMKVGDNSYPVSNQDGSYRYNTKIPMDALTEAFEDAFGESGLSLDKRVLYIHGVPDYTELPESVASLGTIPAQVTLPIACGEIKLLR